MTDSLGALTTIFTEFYYWVTVVLMFLIHVGFCMYEVAISRRKNHLHTLMKNVMVIPIVTISFFLFGWWIYFAFIYGPGIMGGLQSATHALPWSELMGAHLGGAPVQDALTADDTAYWSRINGVFWAAFLLFSWTAASIVSGSVIERIQSGAFWILAVLIGSVFWVIDAAWGWHWDGWMVHKLGYHDAYASGVIHAVAGGFALGVLSVLGARIGKFRKDGTPRNIPPQHPWLVCVGIFLIFTGFWGFYAACNIPIIDFYGGDMLDVDGKSYFTATNIYLGPTTLSAVTLNYLLAISGGFLTGYILSKGDPFWAFSCGLAGVIASSAGNDLYHPLQAMIVSILGSIVAFKMHYWVERRFKIDDAVGACAVHGYAGFFGVVIAGFILWGYPSSPFEGYAVITPWGQLAGAVIMFFVLGFFPGFIVAKILNSFGILRIPREVELAGLDISAEMLSDQEFSELEKALRDES